MGLNTRRLHTIPDKKELTIHHFPAKGDTPARVRVSYRAEPGAQPQERETAFTFAITDEQRRLIQWYLEEYLIYPWGEFRTRAEQIEELMERLGVQLFDAVFHNRAATVTERTYPLYAHVADDLANTRIVIHASEPDKEVEVAKRQRQLIAALVQDGFPPKDAQAVAVALLKEIAKGTEDDPALKTAIALVRRELQ